VNRFSTYLVKMKPQLNIAGSVNSIVVMLLLSAAVISSLEFNGPSDTVLIRNVRQAVGKTTDGSENLTGINMAEEWDEDYAAIFNILLWLGVSLAIATLAICFAIGSMDPGRDSLIYRVTSAQRFKKDN